MACAEAKKLTFHCPPKLANRIEELRLNLERETRLPHVTTTAALVVALDRGLEAIEEDQG
jgi:hypothetical protein